jgi:hypothetical protein
VPPAAPGPCEASAELALSRTLAVIARRDIRNALEFAKKLAMTISCIRSTRRYLRR